MLSFRISSFFVVVNVALAQQYIISTVTGGSPPPTPTAAINASIGQTGYIAADSVGNIIFTSLNAVFKLDKGGTLTRIAGTSRAGYAGDGGNATNAQFWNPAGVAVDRSGNIYVVDGLNNRIRRILPDGRISTVAGGVGDYNGDGGPATAAGLTATSVAVDIAGNLYIACTCEGSFPTSLVRKITPSGIITTIAGNGVMGYSGDGGPAVKAQLSYVEGRRRLGQKSKSAHQEH